MLRTATFALSTRSPSFLVAELARRQGFFEQQGIQANLVVLPANLAIAGLESGEVQYMLALDPAVTAAVQGMPLKLVGCFYTQPQFSLVAARGITHIEELRGKTWAVNSLAGGQYLVTRELMKGLGWDPAQDIAIRVIGQTGERLAALEAGVIQATLLTPDAALKAQDRGLPLLLANAAEKLDIPWVGLALHQRKLERDRIEVIRVLRALRQAATYALQNEDKTVQIMADWLELEPDLAQRTYQLIRPVYTDQLAINREGLAILLAFSKEIAGRLDSPLGIDDVVADDILREL